MYMKKYPMNKTFDEKQNNQIKITPITVKKNIIKLKTTFQKKKMIEKKNNYFEYSRFALKDIDCTFQVYLRLSSRYV